MIPFPFSTFFLILLLPLLPILLCFFLATTIQPNQNSDRSEEGANVVKSGQDATRLQVE